VIENYTYSSQQIQLGRGGWICVVTDGVTEAMNERGELYGSARLLAVLREANDPAEILSAVRDDVRAFAGQAEQSDDLTLLCVRWNGPSER